MAIDLTSLIERGLRDLIGGEKGERAARLYRRFWNPVNYVIVCGIGVGVNMLVLLSLAPLFDLWLANIFAIGTAFLWNWSNTVGPFCHLWGFKKQDKNPVSQEKKTKIEGLEY